MSGKLLPSTASAVRSLLGPLLQADDVKLISRRSTDKHLEYVFAALILMTQLGAHKWGPDAISGLSTLFSHLQARLNTSVSTLIGDLKAAQHDILEWVRGPRLFENLKGLRVSLTISGKNFFSVESIVLLETLFRGQAIKDLLPFLIILYSFLSLHRVIVTAPNPDYSSITNSTDYKPDHVLENMVPEALRNLGIAQGAFMQEFRSRYGSFKYILSTKAGPNGHAMLDAQIDGLALIRDSKVYSAFTSFIEFARIGDVGIDLVSTVRLSQDQIPVQIARTGRIIALEEWGGKTRLVAVLDYWTQAALDPLHQTLGHFLRAIPMDGTYNQTAQVDRVRAQTANFKAEVYSFDLSQATDRFPRSFQETVLSALLSNSAAAQAWGTMLAGRSYHTPDGDVLT